MHVPLLRLPSPDGVLARGRPVLDVPGARRHGHGQERGRDAAQGSGGTLRAGFARSWALSWAAHDDKKVCMTYDYRNCGHERTKA